MGKAETYFRTAARPGLAAVITKKHGEIDLRNASLKRRKALFEAGCEFFQLTKAGARALYGTLRADERANLIAVCTTEEEIQAIESIKSSIPNAVKAAAKKKRAELQNA